MTRTSTNSGISLNSSDMMGKSPPRVGDVLVVVRGTKSVDEVKLKRHFIDALEQTRPNVEEGPRGMLTLHLTSHSTPYESRRRRAC